MFYRDLLIWQKGKEIVRQTYRITSQLPDSEKFGLVSQMQRAAVSIPSNIAEGCGRDSDKYFVQFAHMAKGSIYELITQLEIVKEVYINLTASTEAGLLISELDLLAGMIHSLIKKKGG